jgi:hypothetical protein
MTSVSKSFCAHISRYVSTTLAVKKLSGSIWLIAGDVLICFGLMRLDGDHFERIISAQTHQRSVSCVHQPAAKRRSRAVTAELDLLPGLHPDVLTSKPGPGWPA